MKNDSYTTIDYEELLKAIKEMAIDAAMTLRKLKKKLQEEYGIPFDQYEEMIKIAWNYEELNTQEFTQTDAIKWIKGHMDREKHSGACLYKDSTSPFITMHLFFLDKENQPLLDASDKHLEVHCKMLDDGLEKQFGDKDTIVFK